MTQFRKLHFSLPLAALLLAPPAIAADPQFVDWISISTTTDVAQGTVGAIGVTLSGTVMGPGVVNGTSTIFSGTSFAPPIAKGDSLDLAAYTVASTYTVSFSQAVLDPVFHIADLSTRVTFTGATPAKVSGNSFFSVSGNSVNGGGFAGAGNGTVRLSGVYTSLSFSAIDVIQTPPGGDGFYLQVGVSPVPEPATFALLLAGLFAVGVAARTRGPFQC